MVIRVLAFASAREALGAAEREVHLAGGTLGELAAALAAERPALGELWPRLAIAVDGEIVSGDRPLVDGAEVALLPPVSGGAGQAPAVALSEAPIDVATLLDGVADPRCGAVVLFLGRARDHRGTRAVTGLDYEAYRPMAVAALERIASEVASAHPECRLALVHRLGAVAVGEVTVALAAASSHRSAAFSASRELLERLKREVPIWKRERYADGGAEWREEEPLAPRFLAHGTADWPILE
jgi:molybdopterin synthase catalytic subunit